MGEDNFLLYVQTSDDPERQYSPLVLAQAAKAMDVDAIVYYLGQGLRVLSLGVAEEIKIGNFPSLFDMIKKTLDLGIPIYVCESSKQMLGWADVKLIDGLKIVEANKLNDLVLKAKGTLWF